MMAATAYIFPVFSQNENVGQVEGGREPSKPEVVDKWIHSVEKPAEFPGGIDALYEWVYSNLNYPKQAKKNRVEGDVAVKFTVEKDGTVSDAEILKGIDPLLDEEALRVVKMMPEWEGTKINGQPVRGQYVVEIQFRLSKKDRKKWIMLQNYYDYKKKFKD